MLNSGMILPGNSDIPHRLILWKTRPGEEIRTSKNKKWDGYCKQCCKVIEVMSHIFEYEKNLDKLSMNEGVQRVYGLKSLLGDHYQWYVQKKRNRILAEFSVSNFFIADIMRGRVHCDKLCCRRTRFKLIAYISNLLGSNNVKFNLLGEELKEMLIID